MAINTMHGCGQIQAPTRCESDPLGLLVRLKPNAVTFVNIKFDVVDFARRRFKTLVLLELHKNPRRAYFATVERPWRGENVSNCDVLGHCDTIPTLLDRFARSDQSLRREDHHDPPALHLRVLLQLGDIFQLLRESLDEFEAFVDVGVFAAAEDDAEDHLILVGQELFRAVDLGHEVVVADLGADAEFFVLAVVRVAFVLPLLLLVLEFAVIHDPANGRLFLGRDFDEVEADFLGALEGVDGFENAEHFSFVSDHTDG